MALEDKVHSDANAHRHLSMRAKRAPNAALHEAERDYSNAVCEVDGVRQIDATCDILSLAATADRIVELARKAWTNRPTSDTSSCVEYFPVLIAKEIGDLLAERLGLSEYAARLLDAQISRAAQ